MNLQFIQKKIQVENKPIKNKSLQIFMLSDNPLWVYEIYDYRGLFCGYRTPTSRNPLYKNIS
jgi:hypothetical protein